MDDNDFSLNDFESSQFLIMIYSFAEKPFYPVWYVLLKRVGTSAILIQPLKF